MTSAQRPGSADSNLESVVLADIVDAERSDRPIRRMLRRMREWVSSHRRFEAAYRTLVGILGGGLAIVGLLMVPLPGPGWLVVFLGLAILGTEFHWAKRLAGWLKRALDRFWAWWKARRARKAATKSDLEAAA
jgi:uncharacterized protein (TIGR02611 family)